MGTNGVNGQSATVGSLSPNRNGNSQHQNRRNGNQSVQSQSTSQAVPKPVNSERFRRPEQVNGTDINGLNGRMNELMANGTIQMSPNRNNEYIVHHPDRHSEHDQRRNKSLYGHNFRAHNNGQH